MYKSKLNKAGMIKAFYVRHAAGHRRDRQADKLLMAAIGAGWLEFEPETDTMTWLGVLPEHVSAEKK